MKKIVASLSAFALAFSLYGMPAMALADEMTGPIKQETPVDEAADEDDAVKEPVFTDGSEGELTEPEAPAEDPSFLDAIIGFFTGGDTTSANDEDAKDGSSAEPGEGSEADPAPEADVTPEIDKSREVSGASLQVTFRTAMPKAFQAAAANDPLKLTVGGQSATFAPADGAATVHTAVISGIASGEQEVTISGARHLPLTHTVTFKDGMKHAYEASDSQHITGSISTDSAHLPYGDFAANGALDDEDSALISQAFVAKSTDAGFDLSDDGQVTLKDVQLFAVARGSQARPPATVTETPDSAQTDPEVPEGTTVLLDGKVVTGAAAANALAGLLNGGGHVVGLTASANVVPDAEKQPVSEELPVNLTLKANGALMDRFTLYAPQEANAAVSLPLAGTATIAFERDGEDHQVTLPLPCGSGFETTPAHVLPHINASVDREGGWMHVDLGENVKVYDINLTFTEASDPDSTQVQLTRIAYAATGTGTEQPEQPDDPPLAPTMPGEFTITNTDSQLIEASWEAALDADSYEVEIATANAANETLTTTATSIQVRTFAGAPLVNGTSYSLRVRAVGERSSKSEWTNWLEAVPDLKTPPANPTGLMLEPRYREITATWQPVERADYYTLFYAESGSQEFYQIEVPATDAPERTVRNLKDDTSYTFYVVANNRFGDSSANGKPAQVSARTVFVTTKVPWYHLINRTVQNPDWYLPTDSIKSVTAGGSAEEGAKLVDGNYNTSYDLPERRAVEADAAKVVFHETHTLRELAISTNLGRGYADDIEDVWVRVTHDRATTSYTKANGLTWELAPTREASTQVATNTIMVTLPQVVTNVSQVEVLFQRVNQAPMTISELAFYEATTLQENINALYKLGSYKTQLADNVTQDTIDDLRALVAAPDPETVTDAPGSGERYWRMTTLLDELDVADALLQSADARVVTTHPEIYGTATNVRGANAWQPLGAAAYAGSRVKVCVTPADASAGGDAGDGTKLRLIYARNRGTESVAMQSLGYLTLGVNSFIMPSVGDDYRNEHGGALYVEYEDANCPAYQVKLVGAQQIPLLDLVGVTSNTDVAMRCNTYATELSAYAASVRDVHNAGVHMEQFNEQHCVTNATDIMTDQVLISVPATVMEAGFQEAQADRGVTGGSALAVGLPLTDRFVRLIYQHTGLFDVNDPANAQLVNAYGSNNEVPSTHLGLRYMQTDNTGYVLTDQHIGVDYEHGVGLGTQPSLYLSADGRYSYGNTYSWELSHMLASAVSVTDHALPLSFTDYYAQLITSKDKDEQDGQPAQHFSYDDVRQQLNSNTGANLDKLPNGLGLAVLWQLHLAFDEGYSYTEFASAEEQMAGSIFARMNAYVRNPSAAPAGLVIDGVDADNAFMRLACAATERNLTDFFDAWHLPMNDETRAYAQRFIPDGRQIQHITDDSRKIAGRVLATTDAFEEQAPVASTMAVAPVNDRGEVLISGIGLTEDAPSVLGYEVLRASDDSEFEAIGFIPANRTTFTDRLTTDNGQTLTYAVRAVDAALRASEATEAGTVEAAFAPNLNKAYWTVSTTMNSQDRAEAIIDGSTDTVYRGQRDHEAAGAVGGQTTDASPYASVTIAFGKATDVCGLRYYPGKDANRTIKRLWVQVSNDGVNWTSVGYRELDADAFANADHADVYFTKSLVMPMAEAGEDGLISMQNVSYVRVSDLDTTSDDEISIAELDVFGALPGTATPPAFTTKGGER